MTNLLIKRFIGKDKDVSSPDVRNKYATLASMTGIVVNLLLFAIKLFAGILVSSVAIIADAFNNVSDAGSALITLIGFRLSLKPVDKEHPLGHGRFEYITSFIVDMVIIFVGIELLKSSAEKIFSPELPSVSALTFILLSVAIAVKLWLFSFYGKIAKIIDSGTIKATALDSVSDAVATTLVLVSAVLAKLFGVCVDGYAGVIVAGFIVFSGLKAAKETIDLLLGTPPDPKFIEEICAFALQYNEVVGVHDVMVHDYGAGRQFVSFHAEVPADCDITAAHDVIDCIERETEKRFGCVVTIHMDPIETNDALVNEMKAFAEQTAREIDESYRIHDFRMTYGGRHTNLIFDLCIPTGGRLTKEEAAKEVAAKIAEKKPNCFAVIKAEYPYV